MPNGPCGPQDVKPASRSRAGENASGRPCLPGANRRWWAWLLLTVCIGLPGTGLAAAPILPAVSVGTLPHDPEAFTQGFLYHDGYFYESTGLYGHSSLRRVVPDTGRVLAQRILPKEVFGEGLALVEGRLFQLTWKEGRVFVSKAADLTPAGAFPLEDEGWGACSLDDGRLAVSDGSDRLTFYDPAGFTRLGSVTVTDGDKPVDRLNELEAIAGAIWANVWGEKRIAVIDPATGRVLAWVDCTALSPDVTAANPDNVLNGIACDATTGRIWVTGKRWPVIHEIRVPGLAARMHR